MIHNRFNSIEQKAAKVPQWVGWENPSWSLRASVQKTVKLFMNKSG